MKKKINNIKKIAGKIVASLIVSLIILLMIFATASSLIFAIKF